MAVERTLMTIDDYEQFLDEHPHGSEEDTITAGDVLPEFTMPVAALFKNLD